MTNVIVAVVREISLSPLDGLLDPPRSTASCKSQNTRRIERKAGCKELVGTARARVPSAR